ncbi:MAG: PEP-CTERM sorting domain-containing protein [Hydrogenophilales bacterium 28-61-23]|nr:MAG: PEP-CTERM sorting domain-containing protein [Hydrogenophilales bacterium 28-61-23]
MKKSLLIPVLFLMATGVQVAQAAVTTYNVVETFFEPDTQPRDSIFKGTFDFDNVTQSVTNLQGWLSESMTGNPGAPGVDGDYGMTWLNLTHQLSSVYDATLGGLLVTTFLNDNTNTFTNAGGGDGWSPQSGVDNGGVYFGWPKPAKNPGNAYAMIFVNTTNPLASLTQAQIDKLAYADCAPGGMMGAVCMTGTSVAGYGSIGTMSGVPVSQFITAAPVPEPETYAMMLAGLGMLGFVARNRRQAAG